MRGKPKKLIATLISEEIRRLVADAIAGGNLISASQAADAIVRTYPSCGVPVTGLVNEIALAASRAGVAVEFGIMRRAA